MQSIKIHTSESNDDSEDDVPLKKKAKTASKKPSKTFVVKAKEFNQVTKQRTAKGQPAKVTNSDRTYLEAKPEAGSRETSVYTMVEQGSILWHFKNLTKTKSISKEDADWIAYTAEVWLKSEGAPCPVGVAKMNEELGLKMVPVR